MLLTLPHGSFSLPVVLSHAIKSKSANPCLIVYGAVLPCLLLLFLSSGFSQAESEDYIPAPRSHFVTHRIADFNKPLKFERPENLRLALVGAAADFTVAFYLILVLGVWAQLSHHRGMLRNPPARSPPR